ncbi:hypothetical protein GCM10022271_04220 [Corallibacter vietnamensis]|uniref:DUF306 domain-containing protein n=1 Tax=Corallibacter vietnamensis TaxID=904130 RepID=A0ABP7GTW7_9FLAO
MKLIIILLNLALLNACGSAKTESSLKSNEERTSSNESLSGTYKIHTLGKNNQIDADLTIRFDEENHRVSGFSGCNQFSGSYTISNNILTFGPLVTTKRFCKRFMDIEQDMLKKLQETNTFSLQGDTLKLLTKDTLLIEASLEKTSNSIAQDSNLTIEYVAISRGYYKSIIINKNTLTVQNSRNETPVSRPLSDKEISSIEKELESLDYKNLKDLEAPSKAHQYDGAAGASLKVTLNGETHQTPTFDAGKPNTTIEPLVAQLLSLSEKVE